MPIEIIRKDAWIPEDLHDKMRLWNPRTELGQAVKDTLTMLPYRTVPELVEKANELIARVTNWIVLESQLSVRVFRHPTSPFRIPGSPIEDYGVVSRRVVTDTGVEMLVDVFQSSASGLTFYHHGFGISSAAESTGDTALGSEISTGAYGSADRPTGTQTTGSAGAHVYETVGTLTLDAATCSIEEHGIFKSTAVAATGLWDRSLTGTQTLSSGDQLQATYDLTINSGG